MNHNTKNILLIDYENIQSLDLSKFLNKETDIKIFVGKTQNKIPFELVQVAQQLGSRVQWIKIEEAGNNALDFHISFYLGRFTQEYDQVSFLILSKDKGFDPLIAHINNSKIKCQRIESLPDLEKVKDTNNSKNLEPLAKVITYLTKIQKPKRPQSHRTLHQYMKSILSQNKLSDKEIDGLIHRLTINKKITETNGKIVYNF